MVRRIEGSLLNAVQIFLLVIIVGYFWRFLSLKYATTAMGQAMAFVY